MRARTKNRLLPIMRLSPGWAEDRRKRSPEERLLMALLEDVFQTLQFYRSMKNKNALLMVTEDLWWIEHSHTGLSCPLVCDVLGLDLEAVSRTTAYASDR